MDPKTIKDLIKQGRNSMKMPGKDAYPDYQSDQDLKKPQPPLFKAPMGGKVVSLPTNYDSLPIDSDFLHIINTRASHRIYTEEPMTLLQLSYLLWCTQGVKSIRGRAYATLRTVPCGGARHEFETYLAIQNIEGLEDGLYHYLPQNHAIEFLGPKEGLKTWIGDSLEGQIWANKANAVFYYSFVCYRAEWRYGIFSHRMVTCDAGHITENLYLACTSIGLGGCAIGAVTQTLCDEAFHLDGDEEFIFYAMPVGTISEKDKAKEDDIYAFVKEQNL